MPTQSGAQPVAGKDYLDVGGGVRATVYTDGSVVFFLEDNPQEQVAYIPPGSEDPVVVGPDLAATRAPDDSIVVYSISNPPPEFSGTIPSDAPPGAAPAPPEPPRPPGFPTGPVGTRNPGEDFNYGVTRPGKGVYPAGFGTTVSAATRNPAVPSQGRSEGWGSIGANTENIPYGWGVPGFGKDPIKINEDYLDNLFDPKQAPGYIPGSGTYNQFALNKEGLFGSLPGQQGEVNLAYGRGGPGDPTTGGEIQTPDRWVTGAGSTQAQQGDAAWRAKYGGGGGFDPSFVFQGTPAYQYPQPYPTRQQQPMQQHPPSRGAAVTQDPYGTGGGGYGGGGTGGGFFTAGPGYSPAEQGNLWGQGKTAGLDALVTLFMRSDTPTGVSTAAWGAPQQYWDLLLQAIKSGQIVVSDPQAWAMLQQKNPAYTPQNIGGAALTGTQPGGGSSTEDAIANGNAAEAADRAAYWAYQQAMVRQGDERLALEAARDAWGKAYQQAQLTGKIDGQPTMAAQEFAFQQEMQKVANELAAAGLLGTYQGQQTLAAKAQEFQQKFQTMQHQDTTALGLMGLQAQLSGPRNWDKYQETFNATPQGLKDVMAAFQGRYTLPGAAGAQSTAQGGKASVAGLSGDILSGTYGADGTQQPQSVGNPYQADIRNWNRMQPSQREMILGKAENQGWYGDDFQNMLKSAAPKYAGATGGSYSLFK